MRNGLRDQRLVMERIRIDAARELLDQDAPPSSHGGKLKARVTAIHHDYLTAKLILPEGTLDTNTVDVAKPVEVRRATYNGRTEADPHDSGVDVSYAYTGVQARTVTRDDDGDETTEDQIIIPWYVAHATDGSLIEVEASADVVRNDADSDDVVCPYREVNSGRIFMAI